MPLTGELELKPKIDYKKYRAKRQGEQIKRTRLPKSVLGPEVLRLRRQGLKVSEIAEAIGRTERYVYELLQWTTETGGLLREIPSAKTIEDLDPEIKPMVEFSVEGFEKFFVRFSGNDYLPQHAKEWIRDFLSNRRTLLNVPPGHAKTTIMGVWLTIWLICRNRDEQILLVSKTADGIKKMTNEISYHLAYNEDLIKSFGRFKSDSSEWPWRPASGEFMVEGRRRELLSGDLSIQIRGSQQQILGKRATVIIVDDPTNEQISDSEAERTKLSEWFKMQVMSRLEPGGRALVIGQRVHLRDLYGELEAMRATRMPDSPAVWKPIKYPAVLQWPDPDLGIEPKVLWPERFPFEELMEKYEDVGGYKNFECMYQQNPLPEGESLIRRVWIDGDEKHPGCVDKNRFLGQANRQDVRNTVRVISIDPSPTRFTGVIVADLIQSRELFQLDILDIRRERIGLRGLVELISNLELSYAPIDYLIFEQSTFARWLYEDPIFEQLKRKFRVIGHNTGRNKADPELGVYGLAIDFEFGRIRLPYGDAESRAVSEILIQEGLQFPQGEMDDVLMALWFIKYNYKRMVPIKALNFKMGMGGYWNLPEKVPGWRAFTRG